MPHLNTDHVWDAWADYVCVRHSELYVQPPHPLPTVATPPTNLSPSCSSLYPCFLSAPVPRTCSPRLTSAAPPLPIPGANREQEELRVEKEMAKIRKKFTSSKGLDSYGKRKYETRPPPASRPSAPPFPLIQRHRGQALAPLPKQRRPACTCVDCWWLLAEVPAAPARTRPSLGSRIW